MASIINIRTLELGTRIALSDGSTAKVVSNPRDGVWVFIEYLSSPQDSAIIGTEDMVFAQDVVEVLESLG